MPKVKKIREDIEEVKEPEEIEEEFRDYSKDLPDPEDVERQAKINTFFQFFSGTKEEFVISVYKIGDRNKRVLIDRFNNVMPDPITDLRDIYGGGTYKLFANRPDGRLINSVSFTVAEKINQTGTTPAANPTKTELLNDLKLMKDILGGGSSGDSMVMVKLMENQQKFSEAMVKMQLDGEKRIYEIMDKISERGKQKTGMSELMEAVEFIEAIRGKSEGGNTGNGFMSFLNSPVAQPIINSLLKNDVPKKQIEQKPVLDINRIIESMPVEFIERVKQENAVAIMKELHDKNKSLISENDSGLIVTEILKRKGILK